MQTRFLDISNDNRVPLTNGRYTLTISGVVTDHFLGKTLEPSFTENKEPVYSFNDGIRNYFVKLAVMLSIMAKRIKIPYRYWDKLDVDYVDENPSNFHPSNTVWKFPVGGLRYNASTDFCFIPGFSRYVVSKDGLIYSLCTNRNLSPYSDKEGYWMYGLTPDIGKRTIMGMHRAISLAHIPYPANVDILDVNHLNGIKSDNAIVNLEWAKRKRNCDHAYSTGLRDDNIEVEVRNAFDLSIRTFYSLEECARRLNLDGETVRLRTKSEGQKIYPPGFQFKTRKNTRDWYLFENPQDALRGSSIPLPVIAVDCKTNEIHKFKCATDLSSFLGLTPSGAQYHLKNMEKSKVVRGYRLEYPNFETLAKSSLLETVKEILL